MKKEIKLTWFLFVIILFVSVFFRVKIIHELPLGTTANEYGLTGFDDEHAHFNYTKFILEKNELPILKDKITDPNALTINEFEYHQPPLYYVFIASASKVLSINVDKGILVLGRYINFFLSLLSIIVFYKIFLLFKWRDSKILSAISIYLLLGSSVYQFSVFGNDGLSWFLLWLLFLLLLKGISKNWIWILLIITLSHYTKSSILVFYPVILYSVYNEITKSDISKSHVLKYISIFILPIVLSFPWYLHNYNAYGSYFSVSTITGDAWHFVSSLKESLIKLLHMPYLFLFRMHFDPPKPLLSWFNYIPNIWLILTGGYWLVKMKNILTENYNIQLINILLISMVAAYLYYAIPTGYTEGRLLYPGLPAILYFMTGVLFCKKLKDLFFEGWQLLLILLIFLPSYIIGFYF
ncbi:MAG: hypothetical protein L3J41_07845 [Melioribacteraceae bacterium]|nr:hypothetical protein [Melioribacteraceae bacterium]